MASIAFPKAQGGGVTALSNIKYFSIALGVDNNFVDITGSSAAGVMDTAREYIEAHDMVDVIGTGTIEVSGSNGKAQLGTCTPGTLKMKPGRWRFSKRWPLVDVTGCTAGTADTEKNWEWELPIVGGSASGWVIATGPLIGTKTQTLAMDFDQVGSITGTATVDFQRLPQVKYRGGGPIPCSYNYRYSGGYTYTDDGGAGTENYPILLEDTYDPTKADITIDLDTGESISNSALLYAITISNPATRGGPLPVQLRWRFDQAAAA